MPTPSTHICIVSHSYPTERQPYVQTFIRDHVRVANRINPNKTELYLLSPHVLPFTERWKNQQAPTLDPACTTRVPYISVPRQRAPGFVAGQIARNLIPKLPPPEQSLVHVHWLYPGGMAVPALKKAGYRVILMIHGSDWYKVVKKPWFGPIVGPVLQAADQICVSGDDLKEAILRRYPELHIHVMYNYIDTGLFRPAGEGDRREAQVALGWDPSKKHVLTVANIRHEKGVDRLLKAAIGLRDGLQQGGMRDGMQQGGLRDELQQGGMQQAGMRDDGVVFHLIGQPAQGAYRQEIRELAKELRGERGERGERSDRDDRDDRDGRGNREDQGDRGNGGDRGDRSAQGERTEKHARVEAVLHPPVPREQLAMYYRAADLYTIPSRSEGFNVSLLEAAATGLPVLATHTGGAGIVLQDCAGLLIENGDGTEAGEKRVIEALRSGLQHWLGGKAVRSAESSAFIQQHYSFETYERRLRELYGMQK